MPSVQINHNAVEARVYRNSKVVWRKRYKVSRFKSVENAVLRAKRDANREEKRIPKTVYPTRSNTGIKYLYKYVQPRSHGDEVYYHVKVDHLSVNKKFYVGVDGDFSPEHEKNRIFEARKYLASVIEICAFNDLQSEGI